MDGAGVKSAENERNCAIDILRIISMLFVVIIHMTGIGMTGAEYELLSFPYWFVSIFRCFSYVAVNCFVLISGYYMSVSSIKPKKLLRLWIQVETFSVGLYLLSCLIYPSVVFDWKMLIRYACPLLGDKYWFFTIYFLLMAVSPLLNTVIKNTEKSDYQRYLLVLIALFVIAPTINIFGDRFGTDRGYSLIWFAVLYFVAGYIRKYSLPKLRYGLMYLGISSALVLFRTACDILTEKIKYLEILSCLALQYNTIFVFTASVCLFYCFLNFKPKISAAAGKTITYLSSLSFGIYLFHMHEQVIDILWEDIVRLPDYIDSPARLLARAAAALFAI